jgi:class 3 adenylate cyclase
MASTKDVLEIRPVSLFSWVLVFGILLVVPVLFSYRQAVSRFEGDLREDLRLLQKKQQGVLSRLENEMSSGFQLERLFRRFTRDRVRLAGNPGYRRHMVGLMNRHLPGVKFLWFDPACVPDWKNSDSFGTTTPFKALLEGIASRDRNEEITPALESREAMMFTKLKWFGEEPQTAQIIRKAQTAFSVSFGKTGRHWLIWSFLDDETGDHRRYGGVVMLMEDKRIPPTLGPTAFFWRNRKGLRQEGVELGWVDERNPRAAFFPPSLPRHRRADFARALLKRPVATFDEPDLQLLGNMFHHDSGLVLFTVASTRGILERFAVRRSRMLGVLAGMILLPLLIVAVFRQNGGLALKVGWQVVGLFLFAIGIPTLATIQLGADLIRDHRISAERDASLLMESLNEKIVNGNYLAYKNYEARCRAVIDRVCSAPVSVFALGETATKGLQEHIQTEFRQTGAVHFFIADDSGTILFQHSVSPMRVQEGKDLVPLFGSLARMKLRVLGLPVSGKNDLLDQMLETTIGNLQDIKGVFEKSDYPVNLQGLGKNLYVFAVHRRLPPENKSVVFICVANDVYFERSYLNHFLGVVLTREPELKLGVRLFAAKNEATFDDLLLPDESPASGEYNGAGALSFRKLILDTAAPTLRNAFGVQTQIDHADRKWLFQSIRSKHLFQHSLVFLYDARLIEEKLRRLFQQTAAYVILYVFITLVLAVLMSRGILQPITRLREGVERVGIGRFETRVIMPGRDEFVELSTSFNDMTQGLWERQKMSAYLSKAARESVKERSETRMGGERVFGCVLSATIRGFKAMVESAPPENLVLLLNEYFSRMHVVILRHQGDIDKIAGENLLAVFVPEAGIRDRAMVVRQAVTCGLEMMTGLAEFNQRLKNSLFREQIAIGLGIACGDLVVGNIGSEIRRDFTILGEPVTVAQGIDRESAQGKHSRIIVGRGVVDLLGDRLECERLKSETVTGMTRSVEMFEVIRLRAEG